MKSLLAPLVIAALATPLTAQTIDVNQPSNITCMAGFWQADLAQSFLPTASNCSGASVFTRAGTGGPENVTIALWDALPTAGGTQLAIGTVLGTPGTWVDVFWAPVNVTPGTTYYIVFSSDLGSMCVAGDTSNPYAGGNTFANAGYSSFPTFDYTFRTYYNSGPVLTVTGSSCPSLTFNITGATPGSRVAFLSGRSAASFTVPNGICAGTTLGVSPPTLRALVSIPGSGNFSLTVNLPPVACGTLFLQVVEVGSCSTSNVVAL